MINANIKHVLSESLIYGFSMLLVYMSVDKLQNISDFGQFFSLIRVEKDYSIILSWLIPAVQITIALLLLNYPSRTKGLILFVCFLCVITSGLTYLKFTLTDLPCSCNGIMPSLSWNQQILINIGMIMIAITLYRDQLKSKKSLREEQVIAAS